MAFAPLRTASALASSIAATDDGQPSVKTASTCRTTLKPITRVVELVVRICPASLRTSSCCKRAVSWSRCNAARRRTESRRSRSPPRMRSSNTSAMKAAPPFTIHCTVGSSAANQSSIISTPSRTPLPPSPIGAVPHAGAIVTSRAAIGRASGSANRPTRSRLQRRSIPGKPFRRRSMTPRFAIPARPTKPLETTPHRREVVRT